MLASVITWLIVGLLPIILVVVIQNVIIKTLTPLTLQNKAGRAVYFSTAALGVPIHELSHALAALLFGHKISKIKFFQYTDHHGRLGYVEHRWNALSPIQNIGLFFIGIAPLIGASAIIYLATYLLVPSLISDLSWRITETPIVVDGDPVLDVIHSLQYGLSSAWFAIVSVYGKSNFLPWMLTTSLVALHSVPSKADMSSALKGAIVVSAVVTGVVYLVGEAYPIHSVLASYWLLLVSLMSATIVLSMPWWLIMLAISLVFRNKNEGEL